MKLFNNLRINTKVREKEKKLTKGGEKILKKAIFML